MRSVVSILKNKDGKIKHSCTGTVIDKNTILTAAHCFDDKNFKIIIHYAEKVFTPTKVLISKDYKRVNIRDPYWQFVYDIKIENDIALIKVKEDFLEKDFIKLAVAGHVIDTKTPLIISGFGQFANIAGMGEGEGVYRLSNFTYADEVTPERIRIEDGATGGCLGDSGGPLWAKSGTESWIQVAIVSQGDCNVLSMFERISWLKINQQIFVEFNVINE